MYNAVLANGTIHSRNHYKGIVYSFRNCAGL